MLDFRTSQLKLIALIIRTHSLSEAAKAMGISVSAASRILKKMQLAMNDPLFVRTWKGLIPTETACSMYSTIQELLDCLERLETKQNFDPLNLDSTVKIGAVDNAIPTILAPVIKQIHRSAPKLSFTIYPLDSSHLQKLADGELDFSIYPTIQMPDLPDHYCSLNLFKVTRSVLLDVDHPIAVAYRNGEKISVEDYKKYPRVIVQLKDSGRRALYVLDDIVNKYSQPTIEIPYFHGVPCFLEGTLYTTLLPTKTALLYAGQNPHLFVIPYSDNSDNYARIIWHERSHDNVVMQWVRSFFYEYVQC